jgi:hypothetical protein
MRSTSDIGAFTTKAENFEVGVHQQIRSHGGKNSPFAISRVFTRNFIDISMAISL